MNLPIIPMVFILIVLIVIIVYTTGKKRKRVYCSQCKYFKSELEVIPGDCTWEGLRKWHYHCNHPNNSFSKYDYIGGDWQQPRTKINRGSYKKKPKELNKKNDCKWFERKNNV